MEPNKEIQLLNHSVSEVQNQQSESILGAPIYT